MTAAFVHVGDATELCRALAAHGETIATRGTTPVAVAQIDGHESVIQIIWRADTGTLHLLEVLPMLIAPERTNDLVSLLGYANAQLAMPGWQLRKQETGWKVAYATCAYLDHDAKISTRVAVELLKAIRLAVRETLPGVYGLVAAANAPQRPLAVVPPAGDPAAYVVSVGRARDKLAALPAPAFPAVTDAERARLAAAFARDLPRFADRIATATFADAGTPFFARVRVLRAESPVPFPAQTAFAALTPTSALVLSGRPAALAALCAEEPPAHTSDPDLALVLASFAGMWTGASLLSELRLTSVDDIPFRRASAEDQAREAEVRRAFAAQIAPPSLERLSDGVRVTFWIVSEARLRRRVVEVRGVTVTASEDVVAELPVHPGALWGNVNGRLVPVG